ncbi:MAG TPA: extracellular solute-binding protein [Mycobacteriales bacterium]|nr:extracellular solute-binding protein [Mycobacteriales bacterium]
MDSCIGYSPGIKRRTLLQAFGAAGVAAGLAGCGGSSSKKVTFWLTPNASDQDMAAYVKRMSTGFEKKNKGVTVSSLIIPWENALTKYTAAYSGGAPPDVTYQIIPWMNKWRSTGVLADFHKHLSAADLDPILNGAAKGYIDAAQGPKGELLAVPFTQGYFVLVLNEDIWEKAGKPALPKTYEEMVPFAQALTMDKQGRKLGDSGFDAKNVDHYGMTWPLVPTIQDNYVWQYFWSYGSDYISADHKDIGFDNDAGRAALKAMKAMSDSGAATPPGLYTDTNKWSDTIYAGKAAMQWTDQFTPDQAKQYPKVRFRVLDLPSGPSGRSVVAGCGYWAVSAKSGNIDRAFELAKFLLSPTQADDYIRMILGRPVRTVSGDFYSKPLADPRINMLLNDSTSYGKFARPTLVLPYQPQEYLLGKINDYLSGRQDLDAMIKEASSHIQQMARTS